MKNYAMKLKKSEGYVGIETVVIAALVVAAGWVAMNAIFGEFAVVTENVLLDLDDVGARTFEI